MDLLSLFVNIHGQEMIGNLMQEAFTILRRGLAVSRGYMYNMESHNTTFLVSWGTDTAGYDLYLQMGSYPPGYPVTQFETEKEGCYAEAYHDAYTHCRHTIKFCPAEAKGFLIQDEVLGNRMQKPNVQRWHLFLTWNARKIGEHAVLLEKNGARHSTWSGSAYQQYSSGRREGTESYCKGEQILPQL